jgi:uncharacterized protein YjbJ (UPF0337 family)
MGFFDKLFGRGKKAVGDLKGDAALRREGHHQEQEATAEERAGQHEELAQEARERAAEHHAARDDTTPRQ